MKTFHPPDIRSQSNRTHRNMVPDPKSQAVSYLIEARTLKFNGHFPKSKAVVGVSHQGRVARTSCRHLNSRVKFSCQDLHLWPYFPGKHLKKVRLCVDPHMRPMGCIYSSHRPTYTHLADARPIQDIFCLCLRAKFIPNGSFSADRFSLTKDPTVVRPAGGG